MASDAPVLLPGDKKMVTMYMSNAVLAALDDVKAQKGHGSRADTVEYLLVQTGAYQEPEPVEVETGATL